ncbi:MAG: ABC transporter ATP-binding protein [Spirochaetaceae bacterium]|jgi:simple sugar transport system ATP-binding protein|nr:ABC transporter ATP-binding protein [Spirochaetaceae bacterium]
MDLCVEFKNISKSFGAVIANDKVSLGVRRGEILALLGENGSGKSTLVNMLAGLYTPDSGDILIDGQKRVFSSPRDSMDCGIGMVHQHFKLVPVMTARENILLGRNSTGLFVRRKNGKIATLCEKYWLSAPLDSPVSALSVGQKQSVEILKILYSGARTLILDEPTAVLTPSEINVLFAILRKLKIEGATIIIITHKLNEVMEISDRVSVLRKGKCVATVDTAAASVRSLAEMMVGSAVSLAIRRTPPPPETPKTARLAVKGLTLPGPDKKPLLDNVSFTLRGGEILGVAGIAGQGQRELCESIAGIRRPRGSILFNGEELSGLSPRAIIKRGVAMSFIPEDRLGMGLVAGMDIINNVLLKSFREAPGPLVNRREGRRRAERIVAKYGISTPQVTHIVRKLSGGNIQKVLLGREIEMNPRLLITAYPVRGLDIGSSYGIYDILNEQKQLGVAILFIGEDLDVLMELCDRVMVLHEGRVMRIIDPREATKEEIGLLMLGVASPEELPPAKQPSREPFRALNGAAIALGSTPAPGGGLW